MKTTVIVKYLGDLRSENEHLNSGKKFFVDAPIDKGGKGESFSPTDLVATALADCIITLIGTKALDMGLDLRGTRLEIFKTMNEQPRRIKEIQIEIYFPPIENLEEKNKLILERLVSHCAVGQSLHPDIVQRVTLHFKS